jgi:hypothetical protein
MAALSLVSVLLSRLSQTSCKIIHTFILVLLTSAENDGVFLRNFLENSNDSFYAFFRVPTWILHNLSLLVSMEMNRDIWLSFVNSQKLDCLSRYPADTGPLPCSCGQQVTLKFLTTTDALVLSLWRNSWARSWQPTASANLQCTQRCELSLTPYKPSWLVAVTQRLLAAISEY